MKRDEILAIMRDFKLKHAEQYGITRFGIFGSVARNQYQDDSDIDICIETLTPNPFLLVHIKESLEQLLNRPVDIVRIREKMNPFLKKQISQEALYV